jgi:hypothetical protein
VNADDEHRHAIVRAGAFSLISKEVAIEQLQILVPPFASSHRVRQDFP